jgi:hypothetical protein
VLDLREGAVSIASAGHPRPLLVKANGDAETIAVSGPPLGLVLPEVPAETTIRLAPGDRLFLCSDGVDAHGLACGGPPPDWLVEPLARREADITATAAAAAAVIVERLGPDPEDDWSFLLLAPERGVPSDVPI